jgi:hypothetical protein
MCMIDTLNYLSSCESSKHVFRKTTKVRMITNSTIALSRISKLIFLSVQTPLSSESVVRSISK